MRQIMPKLRSNRGLRGAFLIYLAAAAVPAFAQDPAAQLSSSMRTLATAPKNFQALIAAGRASLALGDTQAAAGFFGRAQEVQPRSPWPQAGMGSAMVMMGDAPGAMTYFTRAQQYGAPHSTIALDRGLAFDLLGQQAQAQSDYRAVLAGTEADEARRRLALSLAIARDIKGAGDMIEPLLLRRDREAIRINAFILALAGDREGARRTIDSAMPGAGARFEPFFQILPVLRPAEKAAAVHLGEFPKDAAQRYAQAQPISSSPVMSIGRTGDPMPVRAAPPRMEQRQAAAAPPRTEPKKEVRVAEAPRRATREAEVANTWIASIRPSLDRSRYASTRRPKPQAETPGTARASEAEDEPRPADPPPASASFDLAELLPQQPPASQSAPPPPEVSAQLPPEVELTPLPEQQERAEPEPEPIADAAPPPAPKPKVERAVPPAPKPKVEVASAKPAAAKPNKPSEPASRHYVQLASGANADRLPDEYRKIRAKKPSLFAGKSVQVSLGKELFRLVVGPFKSREDSAEFVNALDDAGIDGFAYTAPEGLKFEKIAAR